jgi:putative ABC transport system permease protein
MFRNYLTVAVRNLVRHKVHSFINISGLAIGMACCILILLFVQDELSYDRTHENADRIYRILVEYSTGSGQTGKIEATSGPMAPALLDEYPEVIHAVRIRPGGEVLVGYGDKRFYEERFCFTEPGIFDVFTFPLIKGDPKTALKEPDSIVITEEIARKYFGDEDPMGKTLRVDNKQDYRITGVLQKVPSNSHFGFDLFASIGSLSGILEHRFNNWGSFMLETYLLLPEGYPPAQLEEKFPLFIEKYMGEMISASGLKFAFYLQPLTRIHLYSNMDYGIGSEGDIRSIYVVSAIAFFILLIACINFTNLSTARSANRAKEVGMRKVVGANRLQLIKQFLGESVLLSFIALLLSVALVELFLPAFNTLSGKELTIGYCDNHLLLFCLFGIALLVGIFSGGYPAFFLSAFQPVEVLKGSPKRGLKSPLLRRILVVFQFVISIILIIATGIVYDQLNYMRNENLGFDREQVVVMPILRDKSLKERYESIKSELLQHPGILSAAASSQTPGNSFEGFSVRREGNTDTAPNERKVMPHLFIDYDFIETLGIELATGRNFSKDFATDEKKGFLFNESAVKELGWESPEAAIGKQIEWDGWLKGNTIIGVVKDFHFLSLRHKIGPVAMRIYPEYFNCISVKIRPDNIPATLAFLETIWRKFAPSYPFEYFFLDDHFEKLYKAEHKLGKIFGFFSLLAIFIACLGLFGLASFATEQRTKEIGIRKILGASISGIVLLLSKEFTKLVIVSNLVAWPVAYWAMNRWLQDFAYRIHIGVGTFLLAGVLALVIALLTVSFQAVKAALANPVEALRYE